MTGSQHALKQFPKTDEKYEYTKLKVEFLESIIKSLNTRGYNIRSAIDFLKFTMGS
jgi:hypothetical protein